MDPILNLTLVAAGLLLVTLGVATWLPLQSGAQYWGHADTPKRESKPQPPPSPTPEPRPAKPYKFLQKIVARAIARALEPKRGPAARWSIYLLDGAHHGWQALYSGLRYLPQTDEALLLTLEGWIEERQPLGDRPDGPGDFWAAIFWAVGIRYAFILTAGLQVSQPSKADLVRVWEGALRQLIFDKLAQVPPMHPRDVGESPWAPEAAARPEPKPAPDDEGPAPAA